MNDNVLAEKRMLMIDKDLYYILGMMSKAYDKPVEVVAEDILYEFWGNVDKDVWHRLGYLSVKERAEEEERWSSAVSE